MTQATHTPGPWEFRPDGTVSANGTPLLRHYAGRNAVANLPLIAAAPDLLAACTDWIDWLDTCDDLTDAQAATREEAMLASMRAAIAKAGAA